MLEQQDLVCWRRDAHHRSHLRVRHLAATEGIIDGWKFGKLAGDADMLARGDQAPADAPREPVRARLRALQVPAALRVEFTQVSEQPMHGSIEMRRLLRDPFTQLFELTHD